VPEIRLPGTVFGPKGEEVVGGWRRLHNEELQNLYASPYSMVIILRRIRWKGYVARIGDARSACKILIGKLRGKRPLEDLGVDGRIILEKILEK
jgi:hypothetical protein